MIQVVDDIYDGNRSRSTSRLDRSHNVLLPPACIYIGASERNNGTKGIVTNRACVRMLTGSEMCNSTGNDDNSNMT